MSSTLPGFTYDIFISYRHNDNRSGWVTEFVHHLQEELAATIKDPVTVYFDINPHDGLLETHSVDKSLEGKLKSLLFIPILSQTYCDPKSFAWQHEFCAFIKSTAVDQFGRDVTLANGNVSSRILPIRIHDLDAADTALAEKELGGKLRAIDFIYKEAGVNRALKPGDNKQDNLSKTDYQNQVNKVANAIKEILGAMGNSSASPDQPVASSGASVKPVSVGRQRFVAGAIAVVMVAILAWFLAPVVQSEVSAESDRSIAVLAFADMSPSKDQEYLGDGMAEEILNALTRVEGLKVIGRTSSFSFKGKDTDLKTIGRTLGADAILEGSIQKSGNKLRITAQLINAEDETHIWSERYESNDVDIFTIQDDIVNRIVQKLRTAMADDVYMAESLPEVSNKPTSNLAAYEMFLRARHLRSQGINSLEKATEYYLQAIALDPSFALAHAELAHVYWTMALFGLADQKQYLIKARTEVQTAISLDGDSYQAYNMLGYINLTVDWDSVAYLKNYEKAVSLGLPLPDVWRGHYDQFFRSRHDKVISEAEQMVEKDPLSVEALVHLSRTYLYARQYESVIRNGKRALELSPDQSSIFRHVGEAYMFTGRPEMALPYFTRLMEKYPTYAPQDFVAVHVRLGNRKVAFEKFTELKDSMSPEKKAICYIYLDDIDSAFVALDQAVRERDVNLFGMQTDHQFDPIKSDPRYLDIVTRANTPVKPE